ncbi:MAG: hypothetical protein AW07_00951 [Candidatus Accumulibacter sp. SK-11]|nr:MAG: hypothetical protein AW07_00951 [Candidatus Accumulibacter sp. SK-11]
MTYCTKFCTVFGAFAESSSMTMRPMLVRISTVGAAPTAPDSKAPASATMIFLDIRELPGK